MVESQGHVVVDMSKGTVWDLFKAFYLWSADSLLADSF